MLKPTYIIFFVMLCCLCYACKKSIDNTINLPRLQKITTNGMDSVGNYSSIPLYYQFFKYDVNGRVIVINDSGEDWRGWYTGPQPYRIDGDGYTYKSLQYDSKGNLIKSGAGRDSFIYNNKNQIIQRIRKIHSDTSYYSLLNSYAYDIKGRLVADSVYKKHSYSNPNGFLAGYKNFSYDANDNIIQTGVYDNKINPFKSLGLVVYLAYGNVFLLSTNNILVPGYTYEYYPNGLLRKIEYMGFTQEYFYE